MKLNTRNGAKIYTPVSLSLYNWWVLNISNRYAWHCETDKYLTPHFCRYIKEKHMDIGVGTGFYLNKAKSGIRKITLVDLNMYSLAHAKQYIDDEQLVDCLNHDVFEAFPRNLHSSFDSVSLFYVLHCLPGSIFDKKKAIENISETLTDSGILYGATILGDHIEHNALGRMLLSIYNKKGIFSNDSDSLPGLEVMLSSLFQDVSVCIHGSVALFTAKNKRIQCS